MNAGSPVNTVALPPGGPGRVEAEAWLDRELCLSGHLHDARSGLTAMAGLVDLAGDTVPPALRGSCDRVLAAVEQLGRGAGLRWTSQDLGVALGESSCRVELSAPVSLLVVALAGVPHQARELRAVGALARLVIRGVPAIEGDGSWSRRDVDTWLQRSGPGHAGARLRTAARVCGALGQSWQADTDGTGEWIIQIRRTPD